MCWSIEICDVSVFYFFIFERRRWSFIHSLSHASCLSSHQFCFFKKVSYYVFFKIRRHSRPNRNDFILYHMLLNLRPVGTWFERISIMVILLNCVTLGMYQPCENIDCTSDRCQILQVSPTPLSLPWCVCVCVCLM